MSSSIRAHKQSASSATCRVGRPGFEQGGYRTRFQYARGEMRPRLIAFRLFRISGKRILAFAPNMYMDGVITARSGRGVIFQSFLHVVSCQVLLACGVKTKTSGRGACPSRPTMCASSCRKASSWLSSPPTAVVRFSTRFSFFL